MTGKGRLALISLLFLVLLGIGLSAGLKAWPADSQEASRVGQAPAAVPEEAGNGSSDHSAGIFRAFAIILLAAAVGRFGARKLKQPQVLGELVIGMIIAMLLYQLGSPVVTIIRHHDLVGGLEQEVLGRGLCWNETVRERLQVADLSAATKSRIETVLLSPDIAQYLDLARSFRLFSNLGIILLLFMVGLRTNFKELRETGGSAARMAFLGVTLSLGLGYGAAWLLLPPGTGANVLLFLGTAICATSIGITARVFKDLNRLRLKAAKTVLGAAVIDDVLGLVVLAIIVGVVSRGSVQPVTLLLILLKTGLFFGLVALFATKLMQKNIDLFVKVEQEQVKLLYPFGLLMLLAWLADVIGLAPIIGAFAAGVLIKEEYFPIDAATERDQATVESIMAPLEGLFAPVFFVMMGVQVDVSALLHGKVLLLGLALTAVAVLGKLLASLAVRRSRDRLIVGIGMIPRVEVTLIVANIGLGMGVLNRNLFSVLILVVLLTVLLTPPLLKWAIERREA
jgi:Kef-type K+ transport system membrane component KefB